MRSFFRPRSCAADVAISWSRAARSSWSCAPRPGDGEVRFFGEEVEPLDRAIQKVASGLRIHLSPAIAEIEALKARSPGTGSPGRRSRGVRRRLRRGVGRSKCGSPAVLSSMGPSVARSAGSAWASPSWRIFDVPRAAQACRRRSLPFFQDRV